MDMKSIGKKIAKNRKKRNWTQRQLAKQLSVSHQAVSKWEKGDAVPDLDTLVAMARLFGTSVDRLITPKSAPKPPDPAISSFYQEEASQDEEELFEIEDNEEFEVHIDIDDDHGHHQHRHQEAESMDPKLKMLSQIAPFVSREILDEKFLAYLESNSLSSYAAIERLAPFVSKETLGTAIQKVVDEEIDPKVVTQLAPFLNREDLMKLMTKMKDTEWISKNLGRLAPFLPKEYMDELLSNLDF